VWTWQGNGGFNEFVFQSQRLRERHPGLSAASTSLRETRPPIQRLGQNANTPQETFREVPVPGTRSPTHSIPMTWFRGRSPERDPFGFDLPFSNNGRSTTPTMETHEYRHLV
jgi:hypothetical protein